MKQQPRLFEDLNSPYYVYAPPYTRESGGVRAMHQLCHALNLMGEEAYVTTTRVSDRLRTPIVTNQIAAFHNMQKRKPIVIYPEVVNDNPINAEHVVRYLLNLPGFLNKGEITWGADDLIYAHGTDVVPPGLEAELLQIPLVDTHVYNTIGVDDSQRSGNLVFINRFLARGGQLSPVTEGFTEISFRAGRRSPEELAQLYRSSKLLYTYEASTACYEALLCGCPVVYLPNDIMLPKPMHNYLKDAGSAWGDSPAQLEHARRTLADVPVMYEALHQGFWRELETFIDVTQRRVRGSKAAVSAAATAIAQASQVITMDRTRRVVVLSVEPIDAAGAVARLAKPLALADKNWEFIWGVENGAIQVEAMHGADLIVLQGTIAARLSVASLEQIFALGVPVVYDTDARFELAHSPDVDPARAQQWQAGVEYAVRHARVVTVANPSLAEAYGSMAKAVQVVADKVDFSLFRRPVREESDVVHIAVAGSSLDKANFALVDRALRSLEARYGNRIKLTFFGAARPEGWDTDSGASFVEAQHDLAGYARQLRELDVDIALIPRAEGAFNDATSTRPLLEFAAAGAAILTSPRASCRATLEHRQSGLLVGDSETEWLDAVASAIEQPAQRRQLARTAQAEVLKRHDSNAFPSDLRTALQTALGVQPEPAEAAVAGRQDVLRGVLILDRDGDTSRVDTTLRSLEASPLSELMAIVLTTRSEGVPEWTTRLRYVKALANEYAAGMEQLCALPSFDWAMIVEAGNAVHA